MPHDNEIEAEIGGQKIKATGLVVIMLVLTTLLAGMMLYGFIMLQAQDERMQRQHEALIKGMNDVFVAITYSATVSEEKKREMPGMIKKRLQEKVETKAEELTEKK